MGVALLGLTLLLPWMHFADTTVPSDVGRYRLFAEAILDGHTPYRDFFMEYPPGELPAFLAPEVAGRGFDSYAVMFQILAFGLTVATLIATAVAAARLGRRKAQLVGTTAFVAFSPALLGAVCYLRSDIWPTLLSTLAVVTMLARRDRTSAALLGVGAATKLYPALLLPLLVARSAQRHGRAAVTKVVATFAIAFSTIVGPFAILAPGGVGFSFRTQLTRALEIESLGGSILLAAHRVDLYQPTIHAGLSYELLGTGARIVGAAQTLLLAVLLLVIWVVFYRSTRDDSRLMLAIAATIASLVALDKVLSPQYLVWLIPPVALVGRRVGAIGRGLLATAMVLTLTYFPGRFRDLRLLGPTAWIVLARNAILIVLVAVLVQALCFDHANDQTAPSAD